MADRRASHRKVIGVGLSQDAQRPITTFVSRVQVGDGRKFKRCSLIFISWFRRFFLFDAFASFFQQNLSWNKVFYKWANDPEFQDLAGVGFYAWHNGNEESLRWAAKLIRHYVIEGNTEDLAVKYGYLYLPGHLKNGDFEEGLAHWTAKGSVKAVTVKNLDRQYQ